MAAALISCIAFAATPTVLYERGDGTAWSDADLSEWTNDNASYVTQSIDGGLKMTGTNSGWNSTKEITYTENSIVTITATLQAGGAPGRAGSYDFIRIGGAEVRLNDNDMKVSVVIAGNETELGTFNKNYRATAYNITIVINQATKGVNMSVAGAVSGNAEGTLSENLPNNIVIGHFKAGKENYAVNEILKSLKVTEEIQEVAMAQYSVNYLFNGETIKDESGEIAVGAEVSASEPLTIGDQKYYFADGATTSMTIKEGSENVLNVNMREAYVYNYTVSNNVNSDTKTGECVEGESVKIPYNKYILNNNEVWESGHYDSGDYYNYLLSPTSYNFGKEITYTKKELTTDYEGIFFAEAEEIEGMSFTNGSNANIRCSNAAAGYPTENGSVEVYKLHPGKYKVEIGHWGGNKDNVEIDFTVKAGEKVVLESTAKGYFDNPISEEFEVGAETPVYVIGGSSSKPLDYILITGKVDPTYTVKYVDADGKAVKDEVVRYGKEGSQITLTADDIKDFTVGETNYLYDGNDAAEKTVAADGNTVVTVKFHAAKDLNYTVVAKLGEVTKTIASGKVSEGKSVTVPYGLFIYDNGTVWTKAATDNVFEVTVTPTADNYVETLEYTDSQKKGIFFTEAEKIEGIEEANKVADATFSNGAGAYAADPILITTLQPGQYKVSFGFMGDEGNKFIVKAGEKTILTETAGSVGWEQSEISPNFTINEAAAITVEGANSESNLLDYFIISGRVATASDHSYILSYKVGDTKIKDDEEIPGEFGEAIVVDSDAKSDFIDEDTNKKYIFVSDDAEGKTINADAAKTVVTLTFREAEKFNYTVKNKLGNTSVVASTSSNWEKERITVPFSKYVVADGKVYKKEATSYTTSFNLDANNKEVVIEYTEVPADGILFTEAEKIAGVSKTANNSRYSGNAAAYAADAIQVANLPAGKYKVAVGVFGAAGANITVKAGEKTVATAATNGNVIEVPSDEFTLDAETAVTISGTDATHPVDYVLITGKEKHNYTLSYVAGGKEIKTVTKSGLTGEPVVVADEEKADFLNEDNTQKYFFVDEDSEGKTIAGDDSSVVTLNYRLADSYKYTIKNNVNDNVKTGACLEGESMNIPYSRYIIDDNRNVWMKTAAYGNKNQEYNFPIAPTADNFEATLEYTKTDKTDGLYFIEGENIEGMTEVSGPNSSNTNIRCSNAAGGYADEAVTVYTLKAGIYKVAIGVWGNAGDTFVVKAGDKEVISAETKGYWYEAVSDEFTVGEDTALTFEGATSSKPLDYVLVTGGVADGVYTVEGALDGKWYNLQGVQIPEPTSKGIYIHNGKKVIIR